MRTSLIFIGPPGVGKGTQAQKLADQESIAKISTGDILREAVSQKTALGIKAKEYMEKGQLVPDDVMIGMIRERLKNPDCVTGFVLDGFPRTLAQAKALDAILEEQACPVQQVISFEVPDEVLIARLAGRRSCPKCKRVYHVEFNPPRVSGVCDACGDALVQRSDDREETVRNRLKVYEKETSPVIRYYEDLKLLTRLKAQGPVESVFGRLEEILKTGRRAGFSAQR